MLVIFLTDPEHVNDVFRLGAVPVEIHPRIRGLPRDWIARGRVTLLLRCDAILVGQTALTPDERLSATAAKIPVFRSVSALEKWIAGVP